MTDRINFERTKCDKYDYMMAASCGVLAGVVDTFFVGTPGQSVLQGSVDQAADELVKKAAKTFYKLDKRTTKPKSMPDTLEKCISYLEQAFPVPYDARYAQDLKVGKGVLEDMWPGNHHLYSIAHSPDIFGLIFAIIDQFTNTASFVDKGHLIRVEPKKTSGAVPYMQGSNTISRLFCGFVNWLGHLISDLSGSSSTRQAGKTGRGTGIQMLFYELFLFCDFGDIDGNTIAEIAESVFEQGYDVRFAATMTIPTVLNELFIRFIWVLKSHFYGRKKWKQCIPTNSNDDLRAMLLTGTGAMCVVDGIDAFVQSAGNPVAFVSRLNLVGWGKLTMMAMKELMVRYKYAWDDMTLPYAMVNQAVEEYLAAIEAIDIDDFMKETNSYNEFCALMLKVSNEDELNQILKTLMQKMGFDLPWEGDFNEFMSNKKNHLVFS